MNTLMSVNVNEVQGKSKVPILSDLDFEITEGETILMAGPSGCGKSTLLSLIRSNPMTRSHLLNSLLQLLQMRPKYRGSIVKDVNLNIRFASQELTIDKKETVNDALTFDVITDQEFISDSQIEERVNNLTKAFRLKGKENFKISKLSGGEQRRVMIAERCALKVSLDCWHMLICDEPDTGLDVLSQQKLHKLLTGFAKENNMALITVSHNMYDFNIFQYDKLMLLGKGTDRATTIRYFDSPYKLKEHFGTDKLVSTGQEVGIFNQLSTPPMNVIHMQTA